MFDSKFIDRIWQKANIVNNYNPDIWRKDFAGAWIRRDQYGVESKYGWVIDHLKPISVGGTDDFNNLCPMHIQNNRMKSNNYPEFTSVVTAEGDTNIEKVQSWLIRQ